MSDTQWQALIMLVTSVVTLVCKAWVDSARIKYRQGNDGDRRKPNGEAEAHVLGRLGQLERVLVSQFTELRQLLDAHIKEDARQFNLIAEDSALMHKRYHEDSRTTQALVTQVDLLIRGQIRPR